MTINTVKDHIEIDVTGEYGRLVEALMNESSPVELEAMADGAFWFLVTTVGVGVDEMEGLVALEDGVDILVEMPWVLEDLHSDVAQIYEDGVAGGDYGQAADAVRLGVGLLVVGSGRP